MATGAVIPVDPGRRLALAGGGVPGAQTRQVQGVTFRKAANTPGQGRGIAPRPFGAHGVDVVEKRPAGPAADPQARHLHLASLLDQEFGVRLDKRYQRTDWSRRPLGSGQVAYAAADTAFLEALWALLNARAEQRGRAGWVREACRELEGVRHEPSEPTPLAFERLKGAKKLRGEARDRAYSLYEWREQRARHSYRE